LISGFCGGFSTFSAMSIESLTMWQNGNHLMFFTYILVSIIAGIGMVLLGNSFV
jgi:CrcB protein